MEATMALPQESELDGVRFLDDDEARALFDAHVRELLGISGEEFVLRLESGEYADILDDPERPELMYLAMLRRIAE
jgi:hypothetical protein